MADALLSGKQPEPFNTGHVSIMVGFMNCNVNDPSSKRLSARLDTLIESAAEGLGISVLDGVSKVRLSQVQRNACGEGMGTGDGVKIVDPLYTSVECAV